MTVFRDCIVPSAIDLRRTPGCRLWIDGVGTWLVWFAREFRIGNAAPAGVAKWGIQADLRTVHAKCVRSEDWFELEATGEVRVDGLQVETATLLRPPTRVELGADVALKFDVPSPLSGSAVMRIESGHRTADGSTGVVLLDQTCLLGRGKQVHIPCRDWDATVILFVRGDELRWREHGTPGSGDPVSEGTVLSGEDWSFRVESIK